MAAGARRNRSLQLHTEIADHIPNAKFVYLVRDGRDVALSILRGHLHVFHVYFAAGYWAWTQRACLSALADPAHSARIYLLKYENLIADPGDVMRDLMRFIGLEFEGPQLQYYRDEKVLDHARRSRFWKNLARPIDKKNTGMYRDNLSARNLEIFESVHKGRNGSLAVSARQHSKKSFHPLRYPLVSLDRVLAKTILAHGSERRRIPGQGQGESDPSNREQRDSTHRVGTATRK